MAIGLLALPLLAANDGDSEPATADARRPDAPSGSRPPRAAFLIQVPLPITGEVDERVRKHVEQILQRLREQRRQDPDAAPAGRPVLVFEFRSDAESVAAESGATDRVASDGRGSQFERSLAIARFLTSDRLTGVRSVAWLPESVKGHAVLPVIACEEIVMHPDAEFGEAGLGEPFIDNTTRQGYEDIAHRRQTIPSPVVLGMLDRDLEIAQLQLVDGGTRYAAADEAGELEREGKVSKSERVIPRGDLGRFTGREMRLKYQWASHLAATQHELAKAIGVPSQLLVSSSVIADGWQAMRAEVKGRIHTKTINRLQRGIEDARLAGDVNLVCLWIDSPGGSLTASMQLVNYLTSLDSTKLRTVAFVPRHARADAALIALACDELVMVGDALIGGAGEGTARASEFDELRESLRALSEQTGRGWSLPLGLVQPRLELQVYEDRRTGERVVMSREELDEQLESDRWKPVRRLDTRNGVSGADLAELQVVHRVVSNEADFLRTYGLEGMESLGSRWAVSSIERLAVQPWFARTLLFIAFFALISEASAPGLGVAGFISLLCFLLFFWSQFLNGTAEWLEVLLFVGGLSALVVEVFVLPGFGVFGIGGVLMVLASVVLASQTFVIPRNAYQYDQLASSMVTVLAACGGTVTALILMRRMLPHAPLFNRLMLPVPDELEAEEREHREALVHRQHLLGQQGVTKTPLIPSGKVQFGHEVVDVVSDGELVPPGTQVQVVEVRGNRVVVRPID